MDLFFIRHGESANNTLWKRGLDFQTYRVSDPLLSAKGEKQAQFLAEFLANPKGERIYYEPLPRPEKRGPFGITHLYSNLMKRALQTAAPISERLGLPILVHPEMFECGGIYLRTIVDGETIYSLEHGVNAAWLAQNYPQAQLLQDIPEEGWWRGGREEKLESLDRAGRVLNFLKEKHGGTNDRVAVITHGNFFERIFQQLFQFDLDKADFPYQISVFNCGISRIRFTDNFFYLMYHNRTDFFPEELLS